MPALSDALYANLSLQVAYELNNSDAYLNIANFFDALNYGGIAKPVLLCTHAPYRPHAPSAGDVRARCELVLTTPGVYFFCRLSVV